MDLEKQEKIAKEIAKTRESIRKKCKALKTGKIDEDIQLEKQYKPLVEPLKEIIAKTSDTVHPENNTLIVPKKHQSIKRKLFTETITPIKKTSHVTNITDYDDYRDAEDETLQETIVHDTIPEERLSQWYLNAFLKADNTIDYVYGVHINDNNKMMLGNSSFETDDNDDIIINGETYPGTRGLYELIFKKKPSLYTENDMQNYKKILLTTNVHKRGYKEDGTIKGNIGIKYIKIIKPLVTAPKIKQTVIKKTGKGINTALPLMTLSNNVIDYVHWDDPNELVDRLRLLVSSREAGNNNHDNEIISIIEELREAGYIL